MDSSFRLAAVHRWILKYICCVVQYVLSTALYCFLSSSFLFPTVIKSLRRSSNLKSQRRLSAPNDFPLTAHTGDCTIVVLSDSVLLSSWLIVLFYWVILRSGWVLWVKHSVGLRPFLLTDHCQLKGEIPSSQKLLSPSGPIL